MLLTRHMLFVGYSLRDDNFHRLVHQVRAALGPADARARRSRFATALAPFAPGLVGELWADDIDWVSTAHDGTEDPRRCAIVLDRVAALAAAPAAHMLDPSFDALFSDAELELRARVTAVWEALDHKGLQPEVARAVTEALEAIGPRPRPQP